MSHLPGRLRFQRPYRAPRLTFWTLITIGLLIGLYLIAPSKIAVVLYKAALVTGGAVLAYWIDRALFPYGVASRAVDAATSKLSALLDKPLIVEVRSDTDYIHAQVERRAGLQVRRGQQ